MKCHQCGFELPDTAKFCRSCGAKQGQSLVTQSVMESPISTPPIQPKVSVDVVVTPKAQGELSGLESIAIKKSEPAREESSVGSFTSTLAEQNIISPSVKEDPQLSTAQVIKADENHSCTTAQQERENTKATESEDPTQNHPMTVERNAILGEKAPVHQVRLEHTKP